MDQQSDTDPMQRWWGEFTIENDGWQQLQIGPLDLYTRRKGVEWQLAWQSGGSPLTSRFSGLKKIESEPDLTGFDQARYMLSERPAPGGDRSRTPLVLAPRLADRPFVARPEIPLNIAPGEQVRLYVSTVVWVAVRAGDVQLLEVPAVRPSDTWFGRNTREGELCYSSITRARTERNDAVSYPHRATTPVEVRNDSGRPLAIEHIRVPVTSLALFEAQQGGLITDSVRLTRSEGDGEAALEIVSGDQLDGVQKLDEPRVPLSATTIVQAFTQLFG